MTTTRFVWLPTLLVAMTIIYCSGIPTKPECECDMLGSNGPSCDSEGQCSCKSGVSGKNCDTCSAGYYGHPYCQECSCDLDGSVGPICDSQGQCSCKPHIRGRNCDSCMEGLSNYPLCDVN